MRAWRQGAVAAAGPAAVLLLLVPAAGLAPWAAVSGAVLAAGWCLGVAMRDGRRAAGRASLHRNAAIGRQREHQHAVAELQSRLQVEQAIAEALPDPLIVLGPDRRVVRVNPAAGAAFGSEIGAVLRHPGLRAATDRARASAAPQVAALTLPVPVERDVHATVFALGEGRVAALLSDRTRERALERMRADFVANASHELRTPLASLIGFIDTLLGPAADDPPAQARFLAIMAEQAARMNRLIDDLLSLSLIEMTEHQPPTAPVDLAALLYGMQAAFEPRLRARGMVLDLQVSPLPAVAGDEDQLAQVFQNLLDNAVKYGREGGTIRVLAGPAPADGRWPARPGATVAVVDDGAGIPRQHLARLTERFYRVDKGRSRAVGGTGLGLAIVKHIVNRHRGQLAIESRDGEGASFTVWLPALMPPQVHG